MMSVLVAQLVKQGVALPCTITIDDGAMHLVVTATRGSKTYDEGTSDEAFLINVSVASRRDGGD